MTAIIPVMVTVEVVAEGMIKNLVKSCILI
jgi:hypothetical protein